MGHRGPPKKHPASLAVNKYSALGCPVKKYVVPLPLVLAHCTLPPHGGPAGSARERPSLGRQTVRRASGGLGLPYGESLPPGLGRVRATAGASVGVPCATRPPHSPDLNPIENAWALLDGRLAAAKPRGVPGFWRHHLSQPGGQHPSSAYTAILSS